MEYSYTRLRDFLALRAGHFSFTHFLYHHTSLTPHSTIMNLPTHKRCFQSESSISIDDMIDWSEEEPMEEEAAMPPHLLGSLSALDSFGMDDPQQQHSTSSMSEGADTDPLSKSDSVLNPSPLVLSVRKLYPDEEASVESAHTTPTTTYCNKETWETGKVPPKAPNHAPASFTMNATTQHQHAPRRVSDGSEMAVDSATKLARPTLRRGSSHRRDSANSLPTDLAEVMMNFSIVT